MINILLFQFTLAVMLSVLINFIGNRTRVGFGYVNISDISENDSFSYNLFVRILTPTVFITAVVILLYKLNLPIYIDNIFLVVPLYVSILFAILLITRRILLVNSLLLLSIHFLACVLAWAVYKVAWIKGLEYILPDASNFRSELWILLLLYFYSLINNFKPDSSKTKNRKRVYIKTKYKNFKERYIELLEPEFSAHADLRSAFFSIMIVEDMNRGVLFRYAESLLHRFGLVKTTGIMQVSSARLLSDKESIAKAQEIISRAYHKSGSGGYSLIREISEEYNSGYEYANSVNEIFEVIKDIESGLRAFKVQEYSERLSKSYNDSIYRFNPSAENRITIDTKDSKSAELIRQSLTDVSPGVGIDVYDKEKEAKLKSELDEEFKELFIGQGGGLAQGGMPDFIDLILKSPWVFIVGKWIFNRVKDDINEHLWKKVKSSFISAYKAYKESKSKAKISLTVDTERGTRGVFLFESGLEKPDIDLRLNAMTSALKTINSEDPLQFDSTVYEFDKQKNTWIKKEVSSEIESTS